MSIGVLGDSGGDTDDMKLVAYLRNLHIKHSSFASFEFSHSRKDLSTCSSFGWVVLDLLYPYLCPYCENKKIALLCACDTLYFDNIHAYFFTIYAYLFTVLPLDYYQSLLGENESHEVMEQGYYEYIYIYIYIAAQWYIQHRCKYLSFHTFIRQKGVALSCLVQFFLAFPTLMKFVG